MMRVGINTRLLDGLHNTGIQNYILSLQEGFEKEGVDWVGLGSETGARWGSVWFDHWGVRDLIKKEEVDVYHSTSLSLPVGRKLCPYVVTVHDVGFRSLRQWASGKEKVYFEMVLRNSKRKADVVVVDSESVRQELMKYWGWDEESIRVVGLSADEYFGEKESGGYIKKISKKYGVGDKKVVLISGAHSRRKNVKKVVEALEVYKRETVLVITGLVDKDVEIGEREWVRKRGYVEKRELRALYKLADCLVYGSVYEGFGLPVLEAMEAGCLVAGADIGPVREILGEGYEWLFDPWRRSDIRRVVGEVMGVGEKRERQIKQGYRQRLERYKGEKMIREMRSIYESVVVG